MGPPIVDLPSTRYHLRSARPRPPDALAGLPISFPRTRYAVNRRLLAPLLALGLAILQGCATYTTPAAGVNMAALGDADISALMALEPAVQFPARLATVRVQSSGYHSLTADSYGSGQFSVVPLAVVKADGPHLHIQCYQLSQQRCGIHSTAQYQYVLH